MLSEVVPEFRTVAQLRKMFELAAAHLGAGGQLVFNTFPHRGERPLDQVTREVSEQMVSALFSRDELAAAAASLPLRLISDDSTYDYEKEHLPDAAWPPTDWYEGWAAGQDVFDLPKEKCPNELRWLVYRKSQ